MPLLSTKPSSFACVVRFVTNRPVCMLTILVVCTLSVLLSVMQFEFGKRELYLRAPIIFESYDIVRNSDEEIQADRTHLLRGVLFNRQDMKLTNLSSSTLTNNFKSVNNSKAIKNQNVDEEQQEQLQQTSVNDVNRSVEDHYYENMSNNHQRQPLNSSLELAFSLAAENTSDDGMFKFIYQVHISTIDRIGFWLFIVFYRSELLINYRTINRFHVNTVLFERSRRRLWIRVALHQEG